MVKTTKLTLITPADATARTDEILELMPNEWRANSIAAPDIDVSSNETLLGKISRAVPVTMLLDESPDGLPGISQASQITTAHFFLSAPAHKFSAFVSHCWSANPRVLMTALLVHLGIPFITPAALSTQVLNILLFIVYPPAIAVMPILTMHVMILVITLLQKQPSVQRALRIDRVRVWFDKACVHQTSVPLTQAGLSLFGHFLQNSDELLVLFQPLYLASGASMSSHTG